MRTVRGKARGGHVGRRRRRPREECERVEENGSKGEEERVSLRDNYVCLYKVTWYRRNVLIINSIKNLKSNVCRSIFQILMRISADRDSTYN